MESRTQGSRPRLRTPPKKTSEAKIKDSPSEYRHSRGQGQECLRSRPRTKDTNASVLQKKSLQKHFQAISKRNKKHKKKGLQKNFSGVLQELRFKKTFSADRQNFKLSKNTAVQGNFWEQISRKRQFLRAWGFEAKDFKMCSLGRPRGQRRPQGLHLW